MLYCQCSPMSVVCCLLLPVSVWHLLVCFCFPCHLLWTLHTLFGVLPVIVNFLPFSLFACLSFGLDHSLYLNPALSSLVCQIVSVLFVLSTNLTFVKHWVLFFKPLPVFAVLTSACLVSHCVVVLTDLALSACIWLLSWLQTLPVFLDLDFCLLSWTVCH